MFASVVAAAAAVGTQVVKHGKEGRREEAAAAVGATVIYQALLQKLKGPKVEGRERGKRGWGEGRKAASWRDGRWLDSAAAASTALSLDANETQRRRGGTVHLAPTQKVRGDILPSAASTLANAIASLA